MREEGGGGESGPPAAKRIIVDTSLRLLLLRILDYGSSSSRDSLAMLHALARGQPSSLTWVVFDIQGRRR
jgi:hypothetical protein